MHAAVSNYLFRFDTYVALLNSTGGKFESDGWLEFSGCDLVEEIILALKKVCLSSENVTLSHNRTDFF